jgi:hypothetical protein
MYRECTLRRQEPIAHAYVGSVLAHICIPVLSVMFEAIIPANGRHLRMDTSPSAWPLSAARTLDVSDTQKGWFADFRGLRDSE